MDEDARGEGERRAQLQQLVPPVRPLHLGRRLSADRGRVELRGRRRRPAAGLPSGPPRLARPPPTARAPTTSAPASASCSSQAASARTWAGGARRISGATSRSGRPTGSSTRAPSVTTAPGRRRRPAAWPGGLTTAGTSCTRGLGVAEGRSTTQRLATPSSGGGAPGCREAGGAQADQTLSPAWPRAVDVSGATAAADRRPPAARRVHGRGTSASASSRRRGTPTAGERWNAVRIADLWARSVEVTVMGRRVRIAPSQTSSPRDRSQPARRISETSPR